MGGCAAVPKALTGVGAGGALSVGASPRSSMYANTSFLVMRPPFPLPLTWYRSMFCSLAILATTGEINPRSRSRPGDDGTRASAHSSSLSHDPALPFSSVLIPLYLIVQQLGMLDSMLGMIVPFALLGPAVFAARQFMVGLPTETDADIAAIIDLCRMVKAHFLEASRSRKRIGTITV